MLKKIRNLFQDKESRCNQATETLMQSFTTLIEQLSRDFNASVAEEPLQLIVRKPAGGFGERDQQSPYNRLVVHSALWALSIRSSKFTVECFIMPTTELKAIAESETPSTLKLRLSLEAGSSELRQGEPIQRQNGESEGNKNDAEDVWLMDELPVRPQDMETLIRSLLKDIVTRSQGDYELVPESMRLVHGGVSLTRSVRGLVADKHMLMQKIVNQQEAILAQVARDLHDAVLGNVMLLQRSYSGTNKLTNDEEAKVIAEISERLRDICHDLYPRDLRDCGMEALLEQICLDFQHRTGTRTSFRAIGTIPSLTDEVLLHIYRIAQECFNNIGKHALASTVSLALEVHDGRLTMRIEDDGKGFVEEQTTRSDTGTGGNGLSILRERTEMITCVYPARVLLESKPNEGTSLTLEVMFAMPNLRQDDKPG
ncbi:MAG: hypothetical protein K2Z81_18040 [Cyanobacteria bacterium]|nr:hypothetical protein [Cyanobacteriota bacterium]